MFKALGKIFGKKDVSAPEATPLPDLKKSEIENGLLSYIVTHIPGFKAKRSNNTLSRKTDYGLDKIQLMIYSREYGYEIQPWIFVRNNIIEEILIEINPTRKHNPEMITVGNSVSKLMNNPDGLLRNHTELKFEIINEEDLQRVSQELVGLVNDFGQNYFDNYHTLEQIDKALNVFPTETVVHMDLMKNKVKRGIIVARLVENTDYELLLEIYRNSIADLDQDFIDEFENCVSYLAQLDQ